MIKKEILFINFICFYFYNIYGMKFEEEKSIELKIFNNKNRPIRLDLYNNLKDNYTNNSNFFYSQKKYLTTDIIDFNYSLISLFSLFNSYLKTGNDKYLRKYIKDDGRVDKYGHPYININLVYDEYVLWDIKDKITKDGKYYSDLRNDKLFINYKNKDDIYKKYNLEVSIIFFKNDIKQNFNMNLIDNNLQFINKDEYLYKIYILSKYYLPNFNKNKLNRELKILNDNLELEKNNPITNLNYLQISEIEYYIKNLNDIYNSYL